MRVDGVLAVPIGRRPELTTCRQAPTCRRRPSASRTSTIPTTGMTRTILATLTTRTATRIHSTTPLNTAPGTDRKTAAMQLLPSVLALECILPTQLYDRALGHARVQPEKRLQVAILALLAVALA